MGQPRSCNGHITVILRSYCARWDYASSTWDSPAPALPLYHAATNCTAPSHPNPSFDNADGFDADGYDDFVYGAPPPPLRSADVDSACDATIVQQVEGHGTVV